jgi:hypothetical protein
MARIFNCELARRNCLRLPSDQGRTLVTWGVTASLPLARYPPETVFVNRGDACLADIDQARVAKCS